MVTTAQMYHTEHLDRRPCPMCAGAGSLKWMQAPDGALMVERHYVSPVNSPATSAGKVAIGGLNFLTAYKVCTNCGFTAMFNLTFSGDDPANKP